MLLYNDLLDLLLGRARRLGLVDVESGQVDAGELKLYLFQALLEVTELVEVETHMVQNAQIASTSAHVRQYAMPDDYGRLIAPRVGNRRGVFCFDGVRKMDLEYLDPNSFSRMVSPQDTVPTAFTVLRRFLYLYPTPDDNNGADYDISGLYIERIDRPDLQDEVLLAYPTVLIDMALYLLAGDMNRMTPHLERTRQESLAKLTAKQIANAAGVG